MMRKTFFLFPVYLFLWVCAISAGNLPGSARAQKGGESEGNRKQLEKIELKLSTEKRELYKIDSEEKALLKELADLEQEVAREREAISDLSEKIQRERAAVDLLKGELKAKKLLLMHAEDKLSKKLVRLYKHARSSHVRVLAEVTDVAQFWRRVKYLRAIMEEDRMALARAALDAQEHQEEVARIEGRLTQLKADISSNKARQRSLKQGLEKKVFQLMKIHNERKFHETAVLELQAAAVRLKETLSYIEKKAGDRINRTCQFGAFKGKLPYPVEGRVVEDGKVPGSAKTWKHRGVAIEGAPGSRVKVIFPGVVAFSGRLKGYGEIVIVDHGSRFFTISGNLSRRTKTEGDEVKEGDVLGQIGTEGTPGKATLYFEIRRAGKSLNPREWLRPG